MPGNLKIVNLLDGRTVFVVGASRGLGLEYVRQLAEKGCNILASHRGIEVPEGLAAIIAKSGKQVQSIVLDVGEEESIKKAAEKVKEMGITIDCLIHNAGVTSEEPEKSFEECTSEDMMRVLKINAVGPVLVAKYFVPFMKKNGTPPAVLALMTSKVGSIDDNAKGGHYSYRMSKSALNMASKNMSYNLRDEGIAVVLLHPGWVRTDMTGGTGLIDVDLSVKGLILEIERTHLDNYRFVDYKHDYIKW